MRRLISARRDHVVDGVDEDGHKAARAAHKGDQRVRLRAQRLGRDVGHQRDRRRAVGRHRDQRRQKHKDEHHQKPDVLSSDLRGDQTLRLIEGREEVFVVEGVLLGGQLDRAVRKPLEPRLIVGVLPAGDERVYARLGFAAPIAAVLCHIVVDDLRIVDVADPGQQTVLDVFDDRHTDHKQHREDRTPKNERGASAELGFAAPVRKVPEQRQKEDRQQVVQTHNDAVLGILHAEHALQDERHDVVVDFPKAHDAHECKADEQRALEVEFHVDARSARCGSRIRAQFGSGGVCELFLFVVHKFSSYFRDAPSLTVYQFARAFSIVRA